MRESLPMPHTPPQLPPPKLPRRNSAPTPRRASRRTSSARLRSCRPPTATRWSTPRRRRPEQSCPGGARLHKGGIRRHCTSGAARPASETRVVCSAAACLSSLCDGQVLRRGSSCRPREGAAATHWIQGRRALRPSRRRCDARDAEPLPPQEGPLCQVQAAHLRQSERLPPDSCAYLSAV